MKFLLSLVACLFNLQMLSVLNSGLTIKLVQPDLESIKRLSISNFENSTPQFLNDSTLEFRFELNEPVLIRLMIDKSWFKWIWVTNNVTRTISINFKAKNCILLEKNDWDILLDSLLFFESKNLIRTKDSIECNYIQKNRASFKSLWLFTHSHNLFTKNTYEKLKLFNQLDTSLKRYPLYKTTKASVKKRNYPKVNDDFLEFELVNSNKKMFNTQNINNKIIVQHFWSSTCAPCIRELNQWVAFASNIDTSRVKILFICLDPDEKTWLSTSNKFSIPQPNLFAENNLYCDLCLHYNLYAIPYTLIFDKRKKLKQMIEGAEMELVKQKIESL